MEASHLCHRWGGELGELLTDSSVRVLEVVLAVTLFAFCSAFPYQLSLSLPAH